MEEAAAGVGMSQRQATKCVYRTFAREQGIDIAPHPGPNGSTPPPLDCMLPSPKRDDCPNRLYQSERPRSLQEAVGRAQTTRHSKSEDEPRAAVLQGVVTRA
jgi:hypothetical protein